jgi:tRNA pseudouridine38-40 synthase
MLAPYVWNYHLTLDLTTLQNAADQILGTHDFTSFAATDPDLTTREAVNQPAVISTGGAAFATGAESAIEGSSEKPAIRTIRYSQWRRDEDLLIYRITGTGFLHHMVRNLVGTFVEAGAGRIPADSIPTVIAAHNRSAAGPTAPARGLFLIEVEY